MEKKLSKQKTSLVVCTMVLFVGVSAMTFAQHSSEHKKKKNAQQALQQMNQAQNTQQAVQQVDRAQYDQRLMEYRQHHDQQLQAVQQSMDEVQRAKRMAHYRYQQQYSVQMNQQWSRYGNTNNQIYQNDPFFRTAFDRRYMRGGTYYETNRYGVEHIQQAIQYGYAEGYKAGTADRLDHWRSDYERADAYRDANFGYNGYYVSQDDYNYYFREGFQRGYEDGYNRHYRYGRFSNGRYTILDTVLRGIFKFEVFRR